MFEELEQDLQDFIKTQYTEYVSWYKKNWYDVNYMNFDQWFEEEGQDYKNAIRCTNCGEFAPENYGRNTDDGFICEQCLVDGYGQ